jgi:hypothetical protein
MSPHAESTREERAIARRTSGRRDMGTLKPEGIHSSKQRRRNRRLAVRTVNSHFATRVLPFVSFSVAIEWTSSLSYQHSFFHT